MTDTPNIYEAAILALAAGRISYSLVEDAIWESSRSWVWKKSIIRDEQQVTIVARKEPWHFLAQVLECFFCMSFWVSLGIFVAWLLIGPPLAWILAPFALWCVANIVAVKAL